MARAHRTQLTIDPCLWQDGLLRYVQTLNFSLVQRLPFAGPAFANGGEPAPRLQNMSGRTLLNARRAEIVANRRNMDG